MITLGENDGIVTYEKILVARYSPRNKCFAPQDDVLIVKAKENVSANEFVAHYFVSARTPEKTAQFGWVRTRSSFTISDFAREYLPHLSMNDTDKEHLRIMLDSIQGLPEDTPVAATYSRRGIETKKMVFTVHRVILRKS